MKGWIGTLLTGVLTTAPVAAQHTHPAPQYAEREKSGIAAFTPQQLDELRNGVGMGMALPAELNHFPGPRHALEWADSLGLSETQRTQMESIRFRMSEEAVRLGEQVIEAERQLDQRFAHAHIDSATLAEMTARIADLYGRLRYVHLAAHIETRALLSADQIEAYDRVRGYGGG